jgi:hypothetical protein
VKITQSIISEIFLTATINYSQFDTIFHIVISLNCLITLMMIIASSLFHLLSLIKPHLIYYFVPFARNIEIITPMKEFFFSKSKSE